MTKRYKTLQKKLHELEAELSLIFSLPADQTTPWHHLLSEGIEHRFLFLNNLLSAEIASRPSKPHHLRHIAQRLTELEIAFRGWDDYTASAANNFESTASVCSCDESCRNDDGEPYNLPDPALGYSEDNVQGDCPGPVHEEETEKVDSKVAVEKEKRRISMIGRYCGVLVSGMVLGTLLMGATMLGCFDSSSYSTLREGFHTPT